MKYYNKDVTLTFYSLCCGYIEEKLNKEGSKRVQLYREASGFCVKGYDFKNHTRLCWENFNSLAEARKFFKQQISLLGELK